jgi:hypothetical protein
VWKARERLLYYKHSKHVLNANIVRLDVPACKSLPNFWQERNHYENLLKHMSEVLPDEGLRWLRSCEYA